MQGSTAEFQHWRAHALSYERECHKRKHGVASTRITIEPRTGAMIQRVRLMRHDRRTFKVASRSAQRIRSPEWWVGTEGAASRMGRRLADSNRCAHESLKSIGFARNCCLAGVMPNSSGFIVLIAADVQWSWSSCASFKAMEQRTRYDTHFEGDRLDHPQFRSTEGASFGSRSRESAGDWCSSPFPSGEGHRSGERNTSVVLFSDARHSSIRASFWLLAAPTSF